MAVRAVLLLAGLIAGAVAGASPPPLPRTIAEATGGQVEPSRASSLDRRRAVAVAQLTARCMLARGLPYATGPEDAPGIPDPDLGPVAWADRWGFGLSTSVDGPDIADAPPDEVPGGMQAPGPPSGARARIAAALYGSDAVTGCLPLADLAVYGQMDRLLSPLAGDLATLRATERADPRSIAAARKRGDCLRSAGLDATDTASARAMAAIGARLDGLMTSGAPDDPTALQALQALQADERHIAGVIARCDVAFVDAARPAIVDAEVVFVRDHLDALLAIRIARQLAEANLPPEPGR